MPAVEKLEERRTQRIAYKNIVFATDFSDASQRALPYASALARRYGANVALVHALGKEPRIPVPLEPTPYELDLPLIEAERAMGKVADRLEEDHVEYRAVVEHGGVWDVLTAVIERDHSDLIVVGTHGRSGVTKFVLGSVAEEILRLAPCPVLTVGKNVTTGTPEFRTILYATDFSPAANRALPYAISLAEDYRAKLVLLHLVSPLPTVGLGVGLYAPALYAAEELAESQAITCRNAGQKLFSLLADAKLSRAPEYKVGVDTVPEGILSAASKYNADLIVIGASQGASVNAKARLPWTIIHPLVSEATCPVLTVAG